MKLMTILEWLVSSMKKLNEAGVDSPRRDCLVLVEDLLNKDRSWVNAHSDFRLSNGQIKKLDMQVNRRIKRKPLAYIRGKAWFYGRFFEVNPDVLIPRPESEGFIKLLKNIRPKSIADIGTGSGCLAITVKLELPETEVIATDIDKKTLAVARKNAENHGVKVKFIEGSLLEPIKDHAEVVMANLPYVPDGLITSEEINYEPKNALFSGKDGLDHYRKFWEQVKGSAKKPTHILTESLENQHEQMKKLAAAAGYALEKTDILVQQFKRSN